MRGLNPMLGVAAVVLAAAGIAAQAKPSFAGEWKMMVARGQGEPGVDLTITQTATAMTLQYRDGTKLSYALDGSARAMWVGNKLAVTTTTGAGDEKRTLSMEGGYLVVETSAPG